MCIKKLLFQKLMPLFATLIFLVSVSVTTAAADDGGYDDGAADGGYVDDGADVGGYVDDGADSGDSGYDIENGNVDNGYGADDGGESSDGDTSDDSQDTYDQYYDEYINGNDDADDGDSQYVPNENLGELPTVFSGEVLEATAEPLPDVEVSDATLFSGIVMWLCVAVGISVVAGVMVSKRTHRRGA